MGLVRTALFNWAFARHNQGTLVFRIEDTDAARDSEESYEQLLDSMRWLGFDWDEGPEIGGPHAPYRQSQRMDLYKDVAEKLLAAGHAYHCYCTTEELDARRDAARAAGKPSGYDGHCRDLTAEQTAAYEAEGRQPIVRFRMPDEAITFTDLVRGEITFQPGERPGLRHRPRQRRPAVHAGQPGRRRADGDHPRPARRGPALLHPPPDRPLQGADRARHRQGARPAFGHLPYVMGEGNKKLSKRDPQASLNLYRERGFLPEGLLNYLSLLGWSFSADQDIFSIEEHGREVRHRGRQRQPGALRPEEGRGDQRRPHPHAGREGVHRRPATPGCAPRSPTGLPRTSTRPAWEAIAPHAQTRLTVLSDITANVDFLFLEEPVEDEASWAKAMKGDPVALLTTARAKLEAADWASADSLKEAVLAAGEEHGLKLGKAQAPVRVAVTGRTVGLPLFESLEILGKDQTLARIDAALAKLTA